MYNQEIKNSFLCDTIVTKTIMYAARKLFDLTEKYEQEIGKDIAEMNLEEGFSVTKNIAIDTMRLVYDIRSATKTYINWCYSNQVFKKIDTGFLCAILTESYEFSPQIRSRAGILFKDDEDLYYSMRKVTEFNNGYAEPVILALAWVGLDKQTVYGLLDSQVDIYNKRVFDLSGHVIALWESEKISDILLQYVNCVVAERQNKNAVFKVGKDKTRKEFLKKFAPVKSDRFGEPYTARQLDSGLSRFANQYIDLGYPNRMLFMNVWKSGRLFVLHGLEKAGIDVNSKENQEMVCEVFKNAKPIKEILIAYNSYKSEFNL